jgi:hypothetical protein
MYPADLPSSKPFSAASTLWRLALASGDDWKADSAAVTGDEGISEAFEEDR